MVYKYTTTALFNLTQENTFKRFLQKEYGESKPYQEIISWPDKQLELKEGDSFQVKIISNNKPYITTSTIINIEYLDQITYRAENKMCLSLSTIHFLKEENGTKVICEHKIKFKSYFIKILLPFVGIKSEGKDNLKRIYEKINNNQKLIIRHQETIMGINRRLFIALFGFIIGILLI